MSELESAKYWLSWVELGESIALLLVAVGVGWEFVGGRLAAPLRRRIDAAREAEIVQLHSEAENVRLGIAEANARAAEANERAAEARLELAKLRDPRTLLPEQQERIIARLKNFAG